MPFPRFRSFIETMKKRIIRRHARTSYLRRLPLRALGIILILILINILVWAVAGIVLAAKNHRPLLGTSALAYSLGLRHALDADHISAIDLMTRRLVATGQRPVTVGTFFSLGHSTIVVITCIVVAATAAGVQERFSSFSNIGGIVGTSVSAAFLILLGFLNAYILYKLYAQIRKVIRLQPHEAETEGLNFQGGGVIFRMLQKLFKLIDRPWKMYPIGVLFGLGFDTSSEIALLGISGVEGAEGTSIWLILLFPVLFTAGMCLVDTMDGALMMSLYVAPLGVEAAYETEGGLLAQTATPAETTAVGRTSAALHLEDQIHPRAKDPLKFLYYSFILTVLTVICAVVIGILQLLTLVLNTANPSGSFWDGVAAASDAYEYIGASICGMFILVGISSVIFYPRWRRGVDQKRERLGREYVAREEGGLGSGDVKNMRVLSADKTNIPNSTSS